MVSVGGGSGEIGNNMEDYIHKKKNRLNSNSNKWKEVKHHFPFRKGSLYMSRMGPGMCMYVCVPCERKRHSYPEVSAITHPCFSSSLALSEESPEGCSYEHRNDPDFTTLSIAPARHRGLPGTPWGTFGFCGSCLGG